jgi:TRAP transporter TAXI family solute receptor
MLVGIPVGCFIHADVTASIGRQMLRAFLIVLMLAGPATAQDLKLFTLGTGEVGGNYYGAATAICDRVNRAFIGKLRCSPEATPGSIYNLIALRDGQLDFALVQSDWQRYAYQGVESFSEGGAMTNLRSVMSLYPEAITVLARGNSGISQLTDIFGKRIDIGHPASGRHATITHLINLLGASQKDFAAVVELPNGAAIDELCAGRIDATILILGHPSTGIAHALKDCGAVLIPLSGKRVATALSRSSDYTATTIPSTTYPGMVRDIPTFAVTATIVTLADSDPDEVTALVSETLKSLAELSITAPVLARLDAAEMQTRGLTAPLHEGAKAAFALKY